jgi:hypothetical protein
MPKKWHALAGIRFFYSLVKLHQMPTTARIMLLFVAALCAAFVAALGSGFSRAVEPDEYSAGTSVFWFVLAVVFAVPIWVPALIPERYPRALKVCRRLGAAALLLPTYLFGSIVVHNVSRSLSGLGATPSALAQGVVLTIACAACLLVLLWPDLRAYAKRAT